MDAYHAHMLRIHRRWQSDLSTSLVFLGLDCMAMCRMQAMNIKSRRKRKDAIKAFKDARESVQFYIGQLRKLP